MYKNRTCDDLFDVSNEYSDYILGFWIADGHIHLHKDKRKKLGYDKQWGIANTDRDIMFKIANIMNVRCSILKMTDLQISKNYKQMYSIVVYSDKLFDKFYKFSDSVNKSHNLRQLPEVRHFNHFVRGLFDGDGSLHYSKYKNRHGKETSELRSSFTASLDNKVFLSSLSEKLHNMVGVSHKKIHGSNISKLAYGQYDTYKLCKWMYDESTIHMNRKKKIWDESNKDRLLKSIKYRKL